MYESLVTFIDEHFEYRVTALLNWIDWINPILIISGGRLLCKEGPESAGLYIINPHSVTNTFVS